MSVLKRWLKAVEALGELRSVHVPEGRKRHLVKTRRARDAVIALGASFTFVPYDGAYLYLCAEFELAVRQMIEDYVGATNLRVRRYGDLGDSFRKRHLRQSASILADLEQDRFQAAGVTEQQIVSNLHKCLEPSTADYQFHLNEVAFSFTRKNYNWNTLKDSLEGVGILQIGSKLSSRGALRLALGGMSVTQATNALPRFLDQTMLVRNRIIHRNAAYSAPSQHDVLQTAKILQELVTSLHSVLLQHHRALP